MKNKKLINRYLNLMKKLNLINNKQDYKNIFNSNILNYLFILIQKGDWGLGIGDWGLGIGDWAQSPIPNPPSPIPNPPSPIPHQKINKKFNIF